jgi:hypothetical protein
VNILPLNPIPNVITEYQIIISHNGNAFTATDTLVLIFPNELTLLNSTIAYSR